ncbi:MAG: addiction module protein [Verrucomicrobiota bacterium]
MSFAELKTKAMRLRPAQRAKLVSALIQTLDKHEEAPITAAELDRRSKELRSGRVKGVPAEEMLASARRRIRR